MNVTHSGFGLTPGSLGFIRFLFSLAIGTPDFWLQIVVMYDEIESQ